MHNKLTLQEKWKVVIMCCMYNIIRNYVYIAIWPILLLVIYCIMDEVSEIDHFDEV